MAVQAPADEVDPILSTAVDAAFYLAVNPDLANIPGLDPVRHYAEHGWREDRDPAPWFSVGAYLKAYPDVAAIGTDPFLHFLTRGRREGRDVFPSQAGEAYLETRLQRGQTPGWGFEPSLAAPDRGAGRPSEPAAVDPVDPVAARLRADRELIADEFDVPFYLSLRPDVAAAGVDPIEHFLIDGWRENARPNPRFSPSQYLESYPDVAAAGINPFVHFLRTGRAEGRLAHSDLGFRYDIIAELTPVGARVAAAAQAAARLKPKTDAALAAALAKSRTGLRDLHITFSHDDYSANMGGVQLCLQREDARLAELGRDHLHLYPAAVWPVTRAAGEPGPLGVLFNGRRVGMFCGTTVARTLRKAAAAVEAGARSFAVHSLLGHSADETVDIVEAAGLQAGYFWLHDFASLCAGFHLLRNDVEDCGAPPPDSPACGICAYGPWRARHLDAHTRLFERLDLTVISPSETTLAFWRASWSFPTAGEVVHPHARLAPRGPAAPKVRPRPFRLAFAGVPAAHKGWPIFRDLALDHADDDRYAFLHLGAREAPGLPVSFHPVSVSEANPRAMQEAVEALEVDAVLIWSLCRETFSFIAYEAVAGGAAVITGPDSGNVAAFVEGSGHGRVLADEAALAAAFVSGEIAALARSRRKPQLYDLEFSGVTVDLLARGASA
ncbi:hypothetical protein DJ021_09300 [Phenylobacterium hankyongense]|uniref:Glycosyl transferase family 1 domain-containing protein n=1 Tax=Phenylobacterium hankyongense TaxID=1813876 RepID=A0A328B2C8_9CAUL|nr:hypothetical protein [Phenylobacterium hankyongense]RAK59984.1 hypothetical protein DJ021_09300 [Phenylobacterium hankyongense]